LSERLWQSWWEERVDAVSATVDLLMTATDPKDASNAEKTEDCRTMLFAALSAQVQLEPCRETGAVAGLDVVEKIGRGERI